MFKFIIYILFIMAIIGTFMGFVAGNSAAIHSAGIKAIVLFLFIKFVFK